MTDEEAEILSVEVTCPSSLAFAEQSRAEQAARLPTQVSATARRCHGRDGGSRPREVVFAEVTGATADRDQAPGPSIPPHDFFQQGSHLPGVSGGVMSAIVTTAP